MTYSYELSKHNNDVKTEIRKLEAIKYKKLRCKWSQIFNQVCLKENLLPNYTRISEIVLNNRPRNLKLST